MHFHSKKKKQKTKNKKTKNKNKKKTKKKQKKQKKKRDKKKGQKKKMQRYGCVSYLTPSIFVAGFIIGGLGEIFMRDELCESSLRSFIPWIMDYMYWI